MLWPGRRRRELVAATLSLWRVFSVGGGGSRLSFQRRPAFLVGSEERVQMTGCDEVCAMFGVVGGKGRQECWRVVVGVVGGLGIIRKETEPEELAAILWIYSSPREAAS